MVRDHDISRDKTIGDLCQEALWFVIHTFVAVIILAITIGVISLGRPDATSVTPKYVGTVLAFLIPMIGGFIIARIQRSNVARYTWISGLVVFSTVCVWVLDLPTGPGLCEHCGAVEKLWRTFFTFRHGSGLMGGDGLLVGAWLPLSMISYAIGSGLGYCD